MTYKHFKVKIVFVPNDLCTKYGCFVQYHKNNQDRKIIKIDMYPQPLKFNDAE